MSWSLKLRNGDLVSDGAQLNQIVGGAKLVQDLRCAILERMGHDDMHPLFGSLIDGGVDDRGNNVESIIGEVDVELAVMKIESDLRRIMAEHQAKQIERSKYDRYRYGESTLDNSELLGSIDGISFAQAQDKLMVTIAISTGNGRNINLQVPLSNLEV